MGFVGVLLRTSTERPEVLDKGTVVLGGITGEEVNQAVELAGGHGQERGNWHPGPRLPGYQRFDKGVKLIQSYVKIVNRVVWGN